MVPVRASRGAAEWAQVSGGHRSDACDPFTRGRGMEYKYQPGAKAGTIEVIKENPGPGDFGRNSWIQLLR